jgi:hypothetical protein
MSDTSGLNSDASSRSVNLQRSLENRLRAQLGASGSLEYVLTWKSWDMPSGPPICALRARARKSKDGFVTKTVRFDGSPLSSELLTYDRDCIWSPLSGWTTPQAHDATARGSGQKEKHGTKHGCADLNRDAQLAGWVTPSTRDWKDTPGMSTIGTNPDGSERTRLDQLPRQAALAGWPTPNGMEGGHTSRGGDRKDELLMGGLVRGAPSTSSPAPTGKRGVLASELPSWLMGYPVSWQLSAPKTTKRTRERER